MARSYAMNAARKTSGSTADAVFETSLSKMNIETRLAQAHVMLLVMPKDEHDLKSVSLVRYGAYEVRLFEPPAASNSFVFWVELFDGNRHVSIDGGGADDFEEALEKAEHLASCAEKLSREQPES